MNIFEKIRIFFTRIFSNRDVKKIEEPKEPIKKINVEKQKEKEDFFEIYKKIKKREYDLNELSEEQARKEIAILDSEIEMKKKKLDQGITELNILKNENKNYEKNRIIYLYKEVQDGKMDLTQLELEDLKKVRTLFYEEAKIRDIKLGEDIEELEKALIAAANN